MFYQNNEPTQVEITSELLHEAEDELIRSRQANNQPAIDAANAKIASRKAILKRIDPFGVGANY